MEKFEYSDLYKFLVSAGIALVIVSFLLPWFYLKEPFDLSITQEQISKLPKDAQHIISIRKGAILSTVEYLKPASIVLFSLGLTSIIIGVIWWRNAQKVIDIGRLLDNDEKQKRIQQMSTTEIFEKAKSKFNEQTKVDSKPENQVSKEEREEFIIDYLNLEASFFEILKQYFQSRFKVLSNFSIGRYKYDIILQSIGSEPDFLFEIKYLPDSYLNFHFKSSIIQLYEAAKFYTEKTERKVKPILYVILNIEDYKAFKNNPLIWFEEKHFAPKFKVNVEFISIEEFKTFNKERIEQDMAVY